MKRIVALMALVAFACTASAHCGKCDADGDKKPAKVCKCEKKCKGDACKCGCHKKKDADKE